MFVSGYGFNVCITPTYHIERIKWLTVHSLNCYRVSVDFLTSHILENVANCTTLHLLPFLIYMVTKVGCSLLNSTRHLQSSGCSFQSFVGVPLLYVTSVVCWLFCVNDLRKTWQMVWRAFSNMDLYLIFQDFLRTIFVFSSSTYLLMERVLFLLESVCLGRCGKVCCGCASELLSC